MAQDKELNVLIKEMWRIDEKMKEGETLTEVEQDFFEKHLATIASYYHANNKYWNNKKETYGN